MQDIKKIVNYYKRKYNTSDPFEIADRLNILYQFGDLKYEGCYMFLKNHRYIFLNQNLSYHDKQLVMQIVLLYRSRGLPVLSETIQIHLQII